jgi:NADPH-dependent glutamate synthase beta subunit-like oxidoreductase
VTLFEALDKAGGMLRYGIPEFRLPRQVLDEEIGRIIQSGASLRTGVRIGEDMTVEELLGDFDAVLLAAGCYKSIPLNVPGAALKGVYPGLEFMMGVCASRTPVIGDRVLVIGAGFTAFDCARSALRLGANHVSICLRRTEEDLAVTKDEVLETKKEGIKIQSLMLSRRVVGSERVEGVEFVRTRPGDPDPDGKRAIIAIEGSEFMIPADSVIVATGQRPEPMEAGSEREERGVPLADRESFRTARKGLYVAGDYLTGPRRSSKRWAWDAGRRKGLPGT